LARLGRAVKRVDVEEAIVACFGDVFERRVVESAISVAVGGVR
jgi:hypothetical protein